MICLVASLGCNNLDVQSVIVPINAACRPTPPSTRRVRGDYPVCEIQSKRVTFSREPFGASEHWESDDTEGRCGTNQYEFPLGWERRRGSGAHSSQGASFGPLRGDSSQGASHGSLSGRISLPHLVSSSSSLSLPRLVAV